MYIYLSYSIECTLMIIELLLPVIRLNVPIIVVFQSWPIK